MLEITIDSCYKCDRETINDPNKSVNILGLIEGIYKLKLNVTGKLFLISIKTHRIKNIGKN